MNKNFSLIKKKQKKIYYFRLIITIIKFNLNFGFASNNYSVE